jgi:hypothetical protein
MERIRLPLVSVRWQHGAALKTLPVGSKKVKAAGFPLPWLMVSVLPVEGAGILEIGLLGIASDVRLAVPLRAWVGIGHAASLAAVALAWLVSIDGAGCAGAVALALLPAASALALIDALLNVLSDGALIGVGGSGRCPDIIHRDVAPVPVIIIDLAAATTDTHGNKVLLSGN